MTGRLIEAFASLVFLAFDDMAKKVMGVLSISYDKARPPLLGST